MSDPLSEPISRWSSTQDSGRFYLNATAVALEGRAALILGAPGSGKSTLALALLAHGAVLVADDGIWLLADGDHMVVERPANAPDLIEARGIGLLQAGPITPRARLALAVDLDHAEDARLPPRRMVAMETRLAPLIRGARQPHLAQALLHMLRYGRAEL